MAETFRPIQAFDYCKVLIKNMPLETMQVRILDTIHKMIWTSAPWRWTVGTLNVITLVANTATYTVALPADYNYAFDAFRTDGDVDTEDLTIEPILPQVDYKGPVKRIAITGSAGANGTMTVVPKPGVQPSAAQKIVTLYKKTAPDLTKLNIHTPGSLVMPDEWFWVYESGCLWLAYLYADDPRAGQATVSAANGQVQFTGQRALFEANLLSMMSKEKLPSIYERMPPNKKGER